VLLCFIKLILGNLHDVCMLLCCGPSFWSQVFLFFGFIPIGVYVALFLCFCFFVLLNRNWKKNRQNGRKMTSFLGATAKLGACVDNELGGSAPHQCR